MKKLKDYIIQFENVMAPEMCQNLIKTYDSIPKSNDHHIHRSNRIFDFDEIDMTHHEAFRPYLPAMGKLMQRVNREYLRKTSNVLEERLQCYEPFNDFECPRIKRYEPNQGVFDWHIDCANHDSAHRAVVLFWYLNDVEEGGETIFDVGEELIVKPRAGNVICFPPYYMFPHKGATPISGPKYVISSYVKLPQHAPACD